MSAALATIGVNAYLPGALICIGALVLFAVLTSRPCRCQDCMPRYDQQAMPDRWIEPPPLPGSIIRRGQGQELAPPPRRAIPHRQGKALLPRRYE